MGFADLVRCVKIAPLFACIGLAASLAGPLGRAEAINATWSGLVDTILFDCPGLPPPDINCGSTQVIPPSGSYREDPADTLLPTSAGDLSLHAVGARSP